MNSAIREIGFAGVPGATDRPHLSVDGMTPAGPNLSHWPGNRTPRRYKADLSTGICLTFAQDEPARQREFLGGVELALNDHYDTDGFLSLLAVHRPDVALPRESLLLAAAGTGDFQAWHGSTAFAIDRIVLNLAKPASPVAGEFAGLTGPEKDLARYRWLMGNAAEVLDHPERFAGCWREEHDRILAELYAARDGALEREVHADLGFAVARSTTPLARLTLNTLAGAYRVLHALEADGARRFRYHDRTESWFELSSFTPPARRDLRPLAARLQELEGPTDDGLGWFADPPDVPIPELWFGRDEPQAYGAVTRELGASRLPVATVAATIAEHLATAPPAPPPQRGSD